MAAGDYVLAIGLYAEPEDAQADLCTPDVRGLAEGTALLHRGLTSSVLQAGGGGTKAYAVLSGAAAGIVVGVILGRPLLGALVGGVIGVPIGRRMVRREFMAFSMLLDDAIPIGGTGLIAVVLEDDLPSVQAAMLRAVRTTGRVLDEGPLTDVAKTLVRGDPVVTEALDRQARGQR